MTDRLLELTGVQLRFQTYGGRVQALRGVELHVDKGETLGIVGESGCGKSQTALAIMRLTDIPPGEFVGGAIRYHRRTRADPRKREWIDLLEVPESQMRSIRGKDISMIFQEPMTSLNPVMRAGEQIAEAIVNHQDVGVSLGWFDRFALRRGVQTPSYRKAIRAAEPRAIALLSSVGLADAARVMERYPHELSGGMRQRIMIAMALACDPDLLVADEPTTALDVTVQAQIMDVMRKLKARTNAAIILITHHLGVVAEMADRIAVMYAGRIVEEGPARAIFHTPLHPYTLGLLDSIPGVGAERVHELPVIPGSVPDLRSPPAGCAFHPRCPFAFARCAEQMPELQEVGHPAVAGEGDTVAGRQRVACHLYDADQEVPRALREKDASVYRPRKEVDVRDG